jgi:hypothetical protein
MNWNHIGSEQSTTVSSCKHGNEHSRRTGYNADKYGGVQPTFRRNIPPEFSGSKCKPSKKPMWSRQQTEQTACRKARDYLSWKGTSKHKDFWYKNYVSGHYPSSCIYLKTAPVYITKHSVSETWFSLRLQVKPTQLGPIDRASPYLPRSGGRDWLYRLGLNE